MFTEKKTPKNLIFADFIFNSPKVLNLCFSKPKYLVCHCICDIVLQVGSVKTQKGLLNYREPLIYLKLKNASAIKNFFSKTQAIQLDWDTYVIRIPFIRIFETFNCSLILLKSSEIRDCANIQDYRRMPRNKINTTKH